MGPSRRPGKVLLTSWGSPSAHGVRVPRQEQLCTQGGCRGCCQWACPLPERVTSPGDMSWGSRGRLLRPEALTPGRAPPNLDRWGPRWPWTKLCLPSTQSTQRVSHAPVTWCPHAGVKEAWPLPLRRPWASGNQQGRGQRALRERKGVASSRWCPGSASPERGLLAGQSGRGQREKASDHEQATDTVHQQHCSVGTVRPPILRGNSPRPLTVSSLTISSAVVGAATCARSLHQLLWLTACCPALSLPAGPFSRASWATGATPMHRDPKAQEAPSPRQPLT